MSSIQSLRNLPPRQALYLALQEKARREKIRSQKLPISTLTVPADPASVSSLVMTPGHPCHDLNHRNARYKVLYGGRGSGKTWSVAEALIRRAARYPLRVLCTREYQNSIKDSVHKVLSDTIHRLGFTPWFSITQNSIRSRSGAEFIFQGLHGNEQTIKSTEGIDIVWVEEAQTVPESSWRTLTPTIRKEGSEIWITFNPENETDPTYRRYVLAPPPGAIVHHVNYDQNPYMSKTLEDERLYDYSKITLAENDEERQQAQADYDHIWLGMCRRISNELILASKCVLEGFDDDLWKKAERPLYGVDWGFSQDPTVMVRSFIHDRILYVEHEAYGVGVELNELGEFFSSVPEADRWSIKADNARPETISHCRGEFGLNISAADKWKGSVEDGIAFLKGFKKIVIHPRCKHTWQEARSYRYKVDRITKEVLPIIVDKNNHCLAAGTLITTHRGRVPIEEVTTHDRVLTRKGFRNVLWAGVSDTNRDVVDIVTSQGAILRCTPDHKILVNGRFIRADAVRYNDDLLSEMEVVCHEWNQSGTEGNGIIGTLTQNKTRTASTLDGIVASFMSLYGKIITGLSLRGGKFTTRMETQETTPSVIWNASLTQSTVKRMKKSYLLNSKSNGDRGLSASILYHALGTALLRAQNITGGMLKQCWPQLSLSGSTVSGATNLSSTRVQEVSDYTAHRRAVSSTVTLPALTTSQASALGVAKSLCTISTSTKNAARSRVLCISAGKIKEPKVYDITVEDQHEFFANGILVHNCFDSIRYSLDGYITRSGDLGIWQRLGKQS